jgi:hypothetical protein
MKPKYVVSLSPEQRFQLQALVRTGTNTAYRIKHAHILLAVDREGSAWNDEDTAQAYQCHPDTVYHVRRCFVEQGLEEALGRRKQAWPSRRPKLDGEGQAQLTRLACSQAPDGRRHWTLELLGEKLVELHVVESISPQTVMRHLKKTNCVPTCKSNG